MPSRRIIFIPGKNPKPPPEEHWAQLWRCLVEGVSRADEAVAEEIKADPGVLQLTAWNRFFYHEDRDFSQDLPWIDALTKKLAANDRDRKDAHAWKTRFAWLIYTIGDRFPWLVWNIADDAIKSTMREVENYFDNSDAVGDRIRGLLARQLIDAADANERVLLIGHSLGSVIAYDTLWQLSHMKNDSRKIDCFMTLGSPLGLNFVKRRLKGSFEKGRRRYPTNIRSWVNFAAVGELTALDRHFHDDYGEMLELGLVDEIRDHADDMYNYYRSDLGLNVHFSYGYLVNKDTGREIANWWRNTEA